MTGLGLRHGICHEGDDILECERAGVAADVPKPMTSNNGAQGPFDKRDLGYGARNDRYRCPAGKIASHRFTKGKAGKTLHRHRCYAGILKLPFARTTSGSGNWYGANSAYTAAGGVARPAAMCAKTG